jgi:hypothetical protein
MKKRPTIHEIKRLTKENHPLFFTRREMKFFGQRLDDFSIIAQDDGRWLISAPIRNPHTPKGMRTIRYFNPATNTLDLQ